MKIVQGWLLAGVVVFAGLGAHAGCSSPKTIFVDTFTDKLGGWDPDDNFVVGGGAGTLNLPKGNLTYSELNNANGTTDADYCVTITLPTAEAAGKKADGKDNVAQAGLIFGATDYKNFYLFAVDSDGEYGFWRKLNDSWLKVIDFTKSPSVKAGYGVRNEIEAVVKGGLVTLIANGQTLGAMRIQMPDTQSRFGFYVQLDEARPAPTPFEFQSFIVTPPPS